MSVHHAGQRLDVITIGKRDMALLVGGTLRLDREAVASKVFVTFLTSIASRWGHKGVHDILVLEETPLVCGSKLSFH
jgi:hypothetical protein